MELLPKDFYEMEFDDYMLARKGMSTRLLYHESIIRRSTMIVASAFAGGKNVKPDKLWPMEKKKKIEMIEYKGGMMPKTLYDIMMDNRQRRNKRNA